MPNAALRSVSVSLVAGLLVVGLAACRRPAQEPAPEPVGSAVTNVAPPLQTPPSAAVAPLIITPVFHGSLVLEYAGKTVWVDPWSQGNLKQAAKADYVFITHTHPDHLDPAALAVVSDAETVLVAPAAVLDALKENSLPFARRVALANGEVSTFDAFQAEAVPMYNLKRGPAAGQLFHNKGEGNGYVFTFGQERVYVSGDTECTPEMKTLEHIDVALVCMNLPYTMTPAEAAECVSAFQPKVVYPYHYRGSDPKEFQAALQGGPTEVRVLDWYEQ